MRRLGLGTPELASAYKARPDSRPSSQLAKPQANNHYDKRTAAGANEKLPPAGKTASDGALFFVLQLLFSSEGTSDMVRPATPTRLPACSGRSPKAVCLLAAAGLVLLVRFCGPLAAGESRLVLPQECRVAIVGSGLVEQAAGVGYWETALRVLHPRHKFRVRNLGWTGDTVFGEARAEFGTPEDGYRRLLEQVKLVRPHLLLVVYGQNESFAGPDDLLRFRRGVQRLLRDLQAPQRQLVVVLPPRMVTPTGLPPLQWQQQYAETLRQQARAAGALVVDWFHAAWLSSPGKSIPQAYASNGLQLTPLGYWLTAAELARQLGFRPVAWEVTLVVKDGRLQVEQALGTQVAVSRDGQERMAFSCLDAQLPPPLPPVAAGRKQASLPQAWPGYKRVLRIKGLPSGRWVLQAAGQQVAAATAEQWTAGVSLAAGPEFAQTERLRQLVLQKNQWFLHRWRPQNTTYLFGFRKHEQGQNAVEVPQFERLVEELDQRLDRLQQPRRQSYQLVRLP